LPDDLIERARLMENTLIARATGCAIRDPHQYEQLRREFMDDATIKPLLPEFVRTCRTLDVFWPYIKHQAGNYAERRQIIGTAFNPLIEYLEGRNRAPADNIVADVLETFDTAGVHALWTKALNRRTSDPEGAITVARTLLETVCKRILDERSISYSDKEDLPKLYGMVAKALNLAPDQHSEDAIRSILGGAMSVANGIGTLRNKLSDAHGRGKVSARPQARHANLAVNMAGALATFLIETHSDR
jgi:uncharacterized protein YfkK (UPF0435 family)